MESSGLLDYAQQIVQIACNAGATAADAVAIASTDISTSVRNGGIESIEQAESRAIGLRVFVGESSATLSISELSTTAFHALAARAVAIARVAPADPHAKLADAALLAHDITPPDMDAYMPTIQELQHLTRAAEEAGLATAGITNSEGANASASRNQMALVTSHGFAGTYSAASYALSASFIAGSGDTMQRDYDYAMKTHHTELPTPESIGANAAMRAVAKLNPRKLPSQQSPIYFDPRAGRQLLGALMGGISGAAIARGTSFLKDALGQQLFPHHIRITDDPLRPHGLASRPFDAEGVAAKPIDFIADGVLTSWMMDTRSASQLGLTSTGHAARGLSSAPYPTVSNLYLHAGDMSPTELFQQVGDGFYITETIGHGANIITGDYSIGASGFWIENGQRAYPVSEVTIAGNLREMFAMLIPANDLAFHYGVNVPTLALPRMTIAGN